MPEVDPHPSHDGARPFRADDGVVLHRTIDAATGDGVLAHALVVHGFAEHGGRYDALARRWSAEGIEVHRLDLRGHGRSPGTRARIDDADRYVADLVGVLSELQGRSARVAAFGHSFGGALVLRAAQTRPDLLDAVAVTAPFLRSALGDPAWLLAVARAASRWLPNLRTRPLDAGAVSRDPEQVRAYRDDPLVDRGGARLASVRELHDLGARVLRDAAVPTPPTLLVHGSADAVADPDGSRAYAARAEKRGNGHDVTVREVDGGAHALLHDHDAERVLAGTTSWLLDRLGLPARSGTEE
ncbi:MAG: lysophospholipase [Trueperaceae bacterium]